ncbi:hypothetical protein FA048_19300 [Pedobacter polaris]|uniref:Uncharacterized protein n=1 Tax=Pedobacter polaris TaxID=2571273 RepID=A0A4U1CIP2_9SPHI|nr:hypothetical protein [Pedobacter polaris]TKC04610.1 hypothetical protein FA048_19300 [Pedobacter polaris]
MIFISACNYGDHIKEHPVYFDLETYFKQEAVRLAKKNQPIDKTVIINGKAEQKKLIINNWEQEFNSFIDADINKASWKGSFIFTKSDQLEIYTSNSKKIPVKKIEIAYVNEKVKSIRVFIVNTNDLYTSKDSLTYYPDSLYEIKKTQKIKLMDGKQYQVIGKFK